jgi:hypothetical protein
MTLPGPTSHFVKLQMRAPAAGPMRQNHQPTGRCHKITRGPWRPDTPRPHQTLLCTPELGHAPLSWAADKYPA